MSIDLIKRLRLGTGTSPDHELLLEAAKAIEEYRMKYILAAEGKDRAQRRLSELEAQLEELQKQEPVAWMARSGSGTTVLPDERMNKDYYNIPLYTAPIPPDNHDWKAEYLRQVDLHNQTLDELREAEMQLRNPAPIPPEPTPRRQESVPKGFIVVSKDLLAEAIACNTDASLAEARHIINSVLKVSDDEIFREVLKEESK